MAVQFHHAAGHKKTVWRLEGGFLPRQLHFQFGDYTSSVIIQEELPQIGVIYAAAGYNPALPPKTLVVCDENTAHLARKIAGSPLPDFLAFLTLIPGEEHKGWEAVEAILRSAGSGGLGRDGLFIGIGGGVVCDLTAFAASIYMRGCNLALVPTTLLCMVDAALGGKTGFDLGGFKNLAGTFYPAGTIFAATETLAALPQKEWKSGMAELIKTALLDTDTRTFERLREDSTVNSGPGAILPFVEQALKIKGNIVAADPRETGAERALLNLGHTFGHALESALGLGTLSHGGAVAWGMARSCELGLELGITPPLRAEAILTTLNTWGYTTSTEAFLNPGIPDRTCEKFREALLLDKKKKAGKLRFVVPAAERAVLVEWNGQIEQYVKKLT
jgi:3-dehydroquinate synthase